MTRQAAGTVLERVWVDLGPRGYDILIGEDLLADIAGHAGDRLTGQRAAVVADETVAGLYGETVCAALEAAGFAAPLVEVPAGERAKSFQELERLLSRLIDLEIERGDMVVALGGGVAGDLAGFAAAILRRGVALLQCPTTLLAQVDSAVGGKTAIDMPQGKNLVGAFHQPRGVVADLTALDSLPERQRRAGYAEVVKYGLIDRPGFFAWLESHGAEVLAGDRRAQAYAVAESCTAKAALVAADEREAGARALLNLGHTFAHALERAADYEDALLHGEAVAIGCVLAFELSARLGLAPSADADRLRRHFEAVGLPTRPPESLARSTGEQLIGYMGQDKKVSGGALTFVLARGIGEAFLTREVPRETLAALLDETLA